MVITVKANTQKFVIMEKSSSEDAFPTTSESGANCNRKPLNRQEFIGNCKEYRIDTNKSHLRIIGNCNKVRLNHNCGHLEIVGNAVRVKILCNSGRITYTGNCGSLYMGRESPVQEVDYNGNHGVLKIIPSEFLIDDCSKQQKNKKTMKKDCEKIRLGYTGAQTTVKNDHRHSMEGVTTRSSVRIETTGTHSQRSSAEIQIDPNNILCLQVKNNISLPNLVNNINCNSSYLNLNSVSNSAGSLNVKNDTIWTVD